MRLTHIGQVHILHCFPAPAIYGQVAQLVEHVTENHGVGGSIPSLAISHIK